YKWVWVVKDSFNVHFIIPYHNKSEFCRNKVVINIPCFKSKPVQTYRQICEGKTKLTLCVFVQFSFIIVIQYIRICFITVKDSNHVVAYTTGRIHSVLVFKKGQEYWR